MPLFSTKSVDFDGSNDYAITSDGASVDFDHNTPFSISLWFKTTDVSGYLLSKIDNALLRGYGLYIYTSGQLYCNLLNSGAVAITVHTTSGFNTGQWIHGVVTYSGNGLASGFTFYADGVSQAKDAPLTDNLAGATTLNSQPFQINCRSGTIGPLTAQIDDVAIYDKELSAGEVTTIFNGNPTDLRLVGPSTNLVAYYTMGDGDTFPNLRDRQVATPILAAGTVKDRSKNSNNGTPTNMEDADFTTDTPGGVSGFSATLDGVNEDIRFGDQTAHKFAHTDEFSCSVWVKYTSAGNDLIVGKSENAGNFRGWFIAQQASGAIAFVLRSVTPTNLINVTTTATTFNDGAWHHVAVTWDGTTTQGAANAVIIVDGAVEPLSVVTDNLTSTIDTTAEFIIGSRTAAFFAGQVDDVAVYNKALSLAEVQAIYNSGAPTDCTLLDTESSLVGYWGMGEAANDGVMTNMIAGDIELDGARTLWGGTTWDFSTEYGNGEELGELSPGLAWTSTGGGTLEAVVNYKMRALQDPGPGFHVWVVSGAPDFTGVSAPGAIIPGSAVVANTW